MDLMGISYSGKRIVYRKIRAGSSATMRADLDAALLDAGWQHVRAVDNGFVYELTSPQAFHARCLIQDQGGGSLVVQFMAVDESILGFVHHLIWDVAPGYQIVAGCCQMFLSVPGYAATEGPFHSSCTVAGGIPCLPPDTGTECSALGTPSKTLTDCWWSCGNGDDVFSARPDFRAARLCDGPWSCWCGCRNGVLTLPIPNSTGQLCYFSMTPTNNIGGPPAVVKYGNLQPLLLNAFVGWLWTIQGTLWDAFLVSNAQILDEQNTYEDVDSEGNPATLTAIMWNRGNPLGQGAGGTFFGTLALMTASAASLGGYENVAY
jgi:hypothetical protein